MNKKQLKRLKSLQKLEAIPQKLEAQASKKKFTCTRCGQGSFPFKYNQCPICNLAVDAVTYMATAQRQEFRHSDHDEVRLGIEECFRGLEEVPDN